MARLFFGDLPFRFLARSLWSLNTLHTPHAVVNFHDTLCLRWMTQISIVHTPGVSLVFRFGGGYDYPCCRYATFI